ncbi:MAG TPA: hypothetical protein VEG29_00105, partial [Candidatus Binatia bacterium]|nr:hypothetical protein [Candidatus Binatia bacterium]
SGELEACERRHATVFADLAEASGAHLTEAGAEGRLAVLDVAIHELRRAMTWSLESGEVGPGLRIVGTAWRWWQLRSLLREGLEWAQRLLAHPRADADSTDRLLALAAAGGLAYWLQDYATTRWAYAERLALAERLGDPRQIAEAHYDYAFVGVVELDVDLTRRESEAALRMFEEMGDRPGVVRSRQSLVVATFLGGDPKTARALQEQNLADFQATASWYRVADGYMLLAAIARSDGRPGDAIEDARSALRTLPQRVGGSTIGALAVIAIVEGESGDAERAARLVGAIGAIQAETGEALAPVTVLHLPHPVDIVRDRLGADEAERLIAEGAELSADEATALAMGETGG